MPLTNFCPRLCVAFKFLLTMSFDVVYSNAGARSVNLEGILTLFQNLTDIENGHNGSITIC